MENGSFWESHWVISPTDMNNVYLSNQHGPGRRYRLTFNSCIKSNCHHLCSGPVTPGMKTDLAFDMLSLAWRIPMDRGAWRATVHRVSKSRTGWKATEHAGMLSGEAPPTPTPSLPQPFSFTSPLNSASSSQDPHPPRYQAGPLTATDPQALSPHLLSLCDPLSPSPCPWSQVKPASLPSGPLLQILPCLCILHMTSEASPCVQS